MSRKLFIKIILFSISCIWLGVCINIAFPKEEISNNQEMEEVIFKNNSFYTDETIIPEDIYRNNTLNQFFNCLADGEYKEAYEYLTLENRQNVFDNSIENFQKVMQKNMEIIEKNSNISFYEYNIEYYYDETGIVVYEFEENDKYLKITIEDNGPFSQKIKIDLD